MKHSSSSLTAHDDISRRLDGLLLFFAKTGKTGTGNRDILKIESNFNEKTAANRCAADQITPKINFQLQINIFQGRRFFFYNDKVKT